MLVYQVSRIFETESPLVVGWYQAQDIDRPGMAKPMKFRIGNPDIEELHHDVPCCLAS
jgi:hypothetical protein